MTRIVMECALCIRPIQRDLNQRCYRINGRTTMIIIDNLMLVVSIIR